MYINSICRKLREKTDPALITIKLNVSFELSLSFFLYIILIFNIVYFNLDFML